MHAHPPQKGEDPTLSASSSPEDSAHPQEETPPQPHPEALLSPSSQEEQSEETAPTKRSALQQWLLKRSTPELFERMLRLFDRAAIFVVDRDRTILYWNELAEEFLGFQAKEALGHHCLKSIRCTPCMLGCGLAEFGDIRDVPLTLYRADSQAIKLRKTACAFFDEEGAFDGGIEILRMEPTPSQRESSSLPTEPAASHETIATRIKQDATSFHGLLTYDAAMKQVFATIQQVAEMEVSVLIRGESGTGKELVAAALHQESPRQKKPFVAVNCATLTPTLMESQLFGHVKGAFTGAIKEGIGFFRQADGGTLFLDEIAELPLDLQAKLLRVLEQREVTPVGGTQAIPIDVRIISATHRSLREEVKQGRFREDLMYRLRVVPLFLPPLRQRRGDIELLLWHFIEKHNQRGARKINAISPEAMRLLLDHAWPGNVREIQNVIAYAFAVARSQELTLAELPPEFREAAPPSPLPPALSLPPLQEVEPQRIATALHAAKGNVGQAAELLGISRATLWRKRKKYRI